MPDIVIVQLPSPPGINVFREWAGGMGTALGSSRDTWGHDQKYYDIPFSAYLYIARRLELANIPYSYHDLQAREHLHLADFDALLREEKPRVIVTTLNLPSFARDLELLGRARVALPGVSIIVLGPTAKWFKDRLLADGAVDVVMEEGEELLVSENAQALLRDGREGLQGCSIWDDGRVLAKPARIPMNDLDFVDFPAYRLLDFSRYESDHYFGTRYRYATVFTTKGCPYRCGYCPYPFGFGRRLIYRSPARIGADIQRLRDEFGVGQILFRDQVFTINQRHARAVCAELVRRQLDIVWVCETRYDLVDADMLDTMYAAGCREVHYGLESADPEMFANVAKSDGPKSLDRFADVIGWTKARGMRAHVHLIVGMPDESWQTVRNTTQWLRRVKPDSVQLAYFVPYPGTPMYDELRQSRELGDIQTLDWDALGSFVDPVIPTRHLTRAQVRKARHRIAVDWQFTLADRVVNKIKRTVGLTVS
jgi:anaerobic magnesium-protoporphyrin IX monomethyl ester cyclase